MKISKEELVVKIETARERLNASIDGKSQYEEIYDHSVQLDQLIEEYIVSGF